MRFIAMVKATKASEAGAQPSAELLEAMMAFNQEMAAAGVLKGGEGLHPSAKGARVRFSNNGLTVIDGPFAETKELVAGFWLLETGSKAEALDWIKRSPHPMPGEEAEIEIRQMFSPEDFENASPELIETENAMRAAAEGT